MKNLIKKLFLFLSIILTLPLWTAYRLSKSSSLFEGQAQLLALIPGKIGSYLRVSYYSMTLKRCSTQGFIGFGTYIAHPETELGRGYYLGAYNIVGTCIIGDHATIASHVSILSGKNQHGYNVIDKPIQEQIGEFRKIYIGENSWIGNGSIIMDDLGKQNIVAAGSVVVNKTDDYLILAGNPAKTIRKINEQ